MGWILDLASPLGSFRQVARAMRDSTRWPPSEKRNVNTVANKVGHLDAGKDFNWWLDTGRALLPALADVLHETEETLLTRIQRGPTMVAADEHREHPFQMFPALKPLDLATEPLFPGIPPGLTARGGPRTPRTWWQAPPGAGKTLLGRWLEQRYGWTYLHMTSWRPRELPHQGRVYVELDSVEGLGVAELEQVSVDVRLCVAAAVPPPMRRTGASSTDLWGHVGARAATGPPDGWVIIESPPPASWLRALVNWATGRVRRGGGFDHAGLVRLLDDGLANIFQTPGEFIGFMGLVDEVGLDAVAGATGAKPERWIRAWLKAGLDRTDRDASPGAAGLLRRRGPAILVDMEVARMRRGLSQRLPRDVWIELVPDSEAPPVDRDHILSLIDKHGAAAVDEIRTSLAPDGAAVVSGLVHSAMLRPGPGGDLGLWPTWLATVISNLAFSQLLAEGPDGLGTLMLYRSTVGAAMERLMAAVLAGDLETLAACAAADLDTPQHTVALGGAFRVAGFALLMGTELPPELLESLWHRAMSTCRLRYTRWPPVPLIDVATSDPHNGGMTSDGGWLVAAFSMSWQLTEAGCALPSSRVNPWHGLPGEADERQVVLELIRRAGHALERDGETSGRLLGGAYVLGARLLDRLGVLRAGSDIVGIQAPDLLVRLARGEPIDVSEKERSRLLELRFGLDALEQACLRLNASFDATLAWCWQTWGQEQGRWPPWSWLHDSSNSRSVGVERLWRVLPAQALSQSNYRNLRDFDAISGWLSADVWRRWIDVTAETGYRSDSDSVWPYVPLPIAREALASGLLDGYGGGLKATLWHRDPAAMFEQIDTWVAAQFIPYPNTRTEGGALSMLVWSTPAEHSAEMVQRAARWLAEPGLHPGSGSWVVRWLIRVIEDRSPGWREAFNLVRVAETRGA